MQLITESLEALKAFENCLDFMVLIAVKCESYTCPLNKLAYVWPIQSTQSAKICVLRKRSHDRFSPWFCSKGLKYLLPQLLTQR